MHEIGSIPREDLPSEVRAHLWAGLPDLTRFVATGTVEGRWYWSELKLVIPAPLYDDADPRFLSYSVWTVLHRIVP